MTTNHVENTAVPLVKGRKSSVLETIDHDKTAEYHRGVLVILSFGSFLLLCLTQNDNPSPYLFSLGIRQSCSAFPNQPIVELLRRVVLPIQRGIVNSFPLRLGGLDVG